MHVYGPAYEEHLKPLVHSVDPEVPLYSTVTGDRLSGPGALEAAYWRSNLEQPVLFDSALRAALRDTPGKVVLLEIGPHPALKVPVAQILTDLGRTDGVYLNTLVRGKSYEESLLQVAGQLVQHDGENQLR
jgi:acyl transferase domain-containing protein